MSRKKPRSKKMSVFLDIFDFGEEEEDEDEEEVDDLEKFSQALADEEKEIREKEKQLQQRKEPGTFTNPTGSYSRGRGRGRGRGRVRTSGGVLHSSDTVVRGTRTRGRPRGSKHCPQMPERSPTNTPKAVSLKNMKSTSASNKSPINKRQGVSSEEDDEDEEDYLTYTDDTNDGDYKPSRGRGRGRARARGRCRGRGRARRYLISLLGSLQLHHACVQYPQKKPCAFPVTAPVFNCKS